MKAGIDKVIEWLLLIRVGQMLGSDTRLARLVHELIDTLLAVTR
jgi:hypothetical protein